MTKTDFQDGGCGGHLGFPIDTIVAHFPKISNLRSCPFATEQVSAQINSKFGKKCQKLIFKMAVVAAILDFLLAQF